jgi:hypothetical protein
LPAFFANGRKAATYFFAGREWVVPLIDNQYGMGKSTFARNYIRQCRKIRAGGNIHPLLAEGIVILAECHTVFLSLQKGSLHTSSGFSDVLVPALKSRLQELFEVPPACLTQEWKSASAFLKKLVQEAGPIFVVIDEIGSAFVPIGYDINDFNIDSMLESRTKFFAFCTDELLSWLQTPGLFFLLAGRDSFLSFVGRRPDTAPEMVGSPVILERLSLQALRPGPIEDIL